MPSPNLIVIDDFLADPDSVRQFALGQEFLKVYSAGRRTQSQYLHLAPYRELFSQMLGRNVLKWNDSPNGCFQICLAQDAIPYHTDSADRAAVLFLTPQAPISAGISFFASKINGFRRRSKDSKIMEEMFGNGAEYERDRWEEIDRIGNLYNRLVIFDCQLCHGATSYFGSNNISGRLFQNFFLTYLKNYLLSGIVLRKIVQSY